MSQNTLQRILHIKKIYKMIYFILYIQNAPK